MKKIYKHISRPEHSVPARKLLGIADGEGITVGMLEEMLLAGGLTKKMNIAIGSLIAEEGLWDKAMELSKSGDNRVAFRASWCLEWAYTVMPHELEVRWEKFLDDFIRSGNESVQRVYSKMICDMTRRKAVTLSDGDALRLAEKCFDLLIAPKTAVAVKAWQVELLFDLSPRIDWIEDALTETIRSMSEEPDCKPGISSCARHYFKRLGKIEKVAEQDTKQR